jgi:Cytochrome P450
VLVQVTTNFAFLPFGGGRRKCIGDQFALFESIVALAMLVRRFEFEPNASREVGMTTGATIHTTQGLWMHLRPRVHTRPAGGAQRVAANGTDAGGQAELEMVEAA